MARTEQEKILITHFVEFLGTLQGFPLPSISWPDEVERNRKEIDALAIGPNIRFAIELTSIDSYPSQREDTARFSQVILPLEAELDGVFDYRVSLTLHAGVITNGANWGDWHSTLKYWVIQHVPELPFGCGYHDVDGLPFQVFIHKTDTGCGGLHISRFGSVDGVQKRLELLMLEKISKLRRYHETGSKTILVVESTDLALMNVGVMAEAVQQTMALRSDLAVDEIWYADSTCSRFCSIPAHYWRLWPPASEDEWNEMCERNHDSSLPRN